MQATGNTSITAQLNDLETLPLRYIAEGRVVPLELMEALRAFEENRSYSAIDPFSTRCDDAIQIDGPAPTRFFLRYSLAEIVFTLAQEAPEVFRRREDHAERLREVLEADRRLERHPDSRTRFRTVIQRHFRLYSLPETGDLDALADWIYADLERCPGTRLAYEVFQHWRMNQEDLASASDFGDFAHLGCLPYVDLISLDRRMRDYVRRAVRNWPTDLTRRMVENTHDALSRL